MQEGISILVVVAGVVLPFPKYITERAFLEKGLLLYHVLGPCLFEQRVRATRNIPSISIRLLLYIIPI
jgi:hypothetical protein